MRSLIINDLHLDCRRRGGTTAASRKALEDWTLDQFEELLEIPHHTVCILGDLFDKRNVSEHIMKRVIDILRDETVTIVLGNHDLGGVGDNRTMSSAVFVGMMVEADIIAHPVARVIPHLFSQEQFDQAISNHTEECLLTHCNIDNYFAQGDHSLNLTKDQIKTLDDKGVTVICAHEHQARQPYPNVHVIGNQFPTSIADCLGNESKRALVIEDGKLEWITTWTADGSYLEVDYQELADVDLDQWQFIRVTGTIRKSELAGVIKQISDFRKKSSAFVISNAVKILEETREINEVDVTGINVVEMLIEALPQEYRKKVEELV